MNASKVQSSPRTASWILIFLLAGAILLPFGYGLDLGPGPNRIRALIWEYMAAPWFSGVRLVRIGQVLEAVLHTLPTYLLIFQMFSLYRTGSKQTLFVEVGILSAIFPALVSLVQIIGWLQGWTQPPPPVSDHRFPIYIPIPIVPILCLILVRLHPANAKMEFNAG